MSGISTYPFRPQIAHSQCNIDEGNGHESIYSTLTSRRQALAELNANHWPERLSLLQLGG